jgi:hypothetical protein
MIEPQYGDTLAKRVCLAATKGLPEMMRDLERLFSKKALPVPRRCEETNRIDLRPGRRNPRKSFAEIVNKVD